VAVLGELVGLGAADAEDGSGAGSGRCDSDTRTGVGRWVRQEKRGLDKLKYGEVKVSGVGLSISWLVVRLIA